MVSEIPVDATEEWRPVVGWEGWYEVSSLGNVRRSKEHSLNPGTPGKNLSLTPKKHGYVVVQLSVHRARKSYRAHRLVAQAFLGREPLGMEINHKDGNRANNAVCNLEYITSSENKLHAYRNYLRLSGENIHLSKLTNQQAIEIRSLKGTAPGTVIAARYRRVICTPRQIPSAAGLWCADIRLRIGGAIAPPASRERNRLGG